MQRNLRAANRFYWQQLWQGNIAPATADLAVLPFYQQRMHSLQIHPQPVVPPGTS